MVLAPNDQAGSDASSLGLMMDSVTLKQAEGGDRLAGAGFAHDAQTLATIQAERHIAQCLHVALSQGEAHVEVIDVE